MGEGTTWMMLPVEEEVGFLLGFQPSPLPTQPSYK